MKGRRARSTHSAGDDSSVVRLLTVTGSGGGGRGLGAPRRSAGASDFSAGTSPAGQQWSTCPRGFPRHLRQAAGAGGRGTRFIPRGARRHIPAGAFLLPGPGIRRRKRSARFRRARARPREFFRVPLVQHFAGVGLAEQDAFALPIVDRPYWSGCWPIFTGRRTYRDEPSPT